MMSEFIGPALPPGLRPAQDEENEAGVIGSDESIGPRLPANLLSTVKAPDDHEPSELTSTMAAASSFCGPRLPSSSVAFASDINDFAVSSSADAGSASYGPSLPPGFGVNTGGSGEEDEKPLSNSKIIGPPLPPGLSAIETEEGGEEKERDGPGEGEDIDDVIGPMPMVGGVNEADSTVRRRREFESRSKAMKDKLLGKDIPAAPQREEWMTELPPELRPSGIGPRKFRTAASDLGDRSVWTDTPADRQRKAQEAAASGGGEREAGRRKKREEAPDLRAIERDRKLAAMVQEHNKKHRSESLMDMHRKKRKIEEKEKGEVQERRPFNRETDLNAGSSLLTSSKRKALVKDSRGALDTKFTRGARSFL